MPGSLLGPSVRTTLTVLTAALFVVGTGYRARAVKDRPLCGFIENDDAAAHVLVTCAAYQETPAGIHHFLPIYTLGRATDKRVNDFQTAGAMDGYGNFYYTSFPPLAFAAAYAGTGAGFGPPPTPYDVRRLSLAAHLVLVGLSVGLFYLVLKEVTGDRAARWLGALSGGIVLGSAPELLRSYTYTFWAQQVYQVLFVLQVGCLCARRTGWVFGALCAAACLTEWTAYVVNAGVIGYGLLRWKVAGDRSGLAAAAWAAGGTAAGGLALVGWFASVIPVGEYFTNLAVRFQARKAAGGWMLPELCRGYLASAGFFLAVPVMIVVRLLERAENGHATPVRPLTGVRRLVTTYPGCAALAGLTAWSLAENVLCMQHAIIYTFDRIKFVYLIAVGAAVLVGCLRSHTLTALLLVVGGLHLGHFVSAAGEREPADTAWRHLDAFYGSLVRKHARDGEVVFMTAHVLGSKVYYAHRNLIELPGREVEPEGTMRRYHEFILRNARAAGAATSLVVVARDEVPSFADGCHAPGPRPPELYRVDTQSGEVTHLPRETP